MESFGDLISLMNHTFPESSVDLISLKTETLSVMGFNIKVSQWVISNGGRAEDGLWRRESMVKSNFGGLHNRMIFTFGAKKFLLMDLRLKFPCY